MTNKKLLTTTAMTVLAVGALTGNVYSQASKFQGPYISIGAATTQSESTINNDEVTGISTSAAYTDSASVTAGYVGFNSASNKMINRAAQVLKGSAEGKITATGSLGYNFLIDNAENQIKKIEINNKQKTTGGSSTTRKKITSKQKHSNSKTARNKTTKIERRPLRKKSHHKKYKEEKS